MVHYNQVVVYPSAKHGFTDNAIRHAIDNAVSVVDVGDGMLILGADHSGRLIEAFGRQGDVGP